MVQRRRVLALAAALLLAVCQAVDVGELEDSSCPNVTTVSVSNSTSSSRRNSVQITAASTCTSTVVKVSTSSSGRRTLDLRKRDIEAVTSLPAVDVVRLDNNQLRSFKTANNISELHLTNNSIPSLSEFTFPSTLTFLDLANNALGDIDSVAFSASLQYLNLSGNPIGSLSNVSLPSNLLELDMADSSLASLENFSFPSSVTTLNFSNNPITTIRGVIFPDDLTGMTLIAASAAAAVSSTTVVSPAEARRLQTTDADATTPSVLQEFEVRQTDADIFETLTVWDVSTTSTLSCSDSSANPRYVDDTMLCVLSDSEFAAKYQAVVIEASSGSKTSSIWGTASSSQADERVVLKETLDQRRSWFLIGASALLAAFVLLACVNAFCLCLRRKLCGISKAKKNKPTLTKTASGHTKNFWQDSLPPEDDEALHLLSSNALRTEDVEQPESEQEETNESLIKAKKATDPLVYLRQDVKRYEVSSSLLKHKKPLSSDHDGKDQDEGNGESTSPFVYYKADYRGKLVVLKTLSISRQVERKSGAPTAISSELWSFVEEIRLSSTLSHPQLVAFYGYAEVPFGDKRVESKALALMMECMDRGDLNAFIQNHRRLRKQTQPTKRSKSLPKGVSWQDEDQDNLIVSSDSDNNYDSEDDKVSTELWSWRATSPGYKSKLSIAVDVAKVLNYLHAFSPPLFHGNLSSRKIFLDRDWNVKLGDLTCCSALRRWSSSHRNDAVSPPGSAGSSIRVSEVSSSASSEIPMDMSVWTAPEVLDGRQYTQKADIYSFGVLLAQLTSYECSSSEHSLMDDTEVPMLNNELQDNALVDEDAPTPIRLLMFRCQAFQPEGRPTAEELVHELLEIQSEIQDQTRL